MKALICGFARNMLDLHARGRLVQSQSRWIEAHVGHCAKCAAEVSAWKAMFESLRALPPMRAPEGLKAQLKAAVQGQARQKVAVSLDNTSGEIWHARYASPMTLAFGLTVFIFSISASIFGPGISSQSCSDQDVSVCAVPFGSAHSIFGGNR